MRSRVDIIFELDHLDLHHQFFQDKEAGKPPDTAAVCEWSMRCLSAQFQTYQMRAGVSSPRQSRRSSYLVRWEPPVGGATGSEASLTAAGTESARASEARLSDVVRRLKPSIL